MKKRILSIVLVVVMVTTLLAGCATEEKATLTEDGKMMITTAGLSGGMQTFPVYVATEKGWFAEENIEVETIYFENGPVQMEALASGSWDVAMTGIGGVLTGAIGYDAVVIGAPHSDDATQIAFARKDSEIVASGQGHNTINADLYGDAEAWKGKKVLCSAGTVLQYLLIKNLQGIGLTIDDVEFLSMDTPTANSAFLQGEGDVTILSGVVSFAEDKADFVQVASGPLVETGLVCNVVATEDAVENKKEEVKAFTKAYFRAVEWIDANKGEATDLFVEFAEESGKTVSREVADVFINAETFYSLEDNYNMMKVDDGEEMSSMEAGLMGVLDFFIEAGNYSEGDDERFAGHMYPDFVNEIYEETK